jgi:hypothetical protein
MHNEWNQTIWKGVPNGRIDRDSHGPMYSHWLDSNKYKMWVREVLAAYLNGQYGYILQDQFSVHLREE